VKSTNSGLSTFPNFILNEITFIFFISYYKGSCKRLEKAIKQTAKLYITISV